MESEKLWESKKFLSSNANICKTSSRSDLEVMYQCCITYLHLMLKGAIMFLCRLLRVCHLFGERSTVIGQGDAHDRARHTSDSRCCYFPEIADKDRRFNNLINYSSNALYCRVCTFMWFTFCAYSVICHIQD